MIKAIAKWIIGLFKKGDPSNVVEEYYQVLQKLKVKGFKICSECGRIKPLSDFNRAGRGHRANCKECHAKQQAKSRQNMTHFAIEKKKCSHCGEVKSVQEFYKDKTKKSGYHSWCKQCIEARKNEKSGTPTTLF